MANKLLPKTPIALGAWKAARLKAGLAFNGSLDRLIQQALAEFKPLPSGLNKCPSCGAAELELASTLVEVRELVVEEVPGHRCNSCGEALPPPVSLLVALEEIAEEMGPGKVTWPELIGDE